MSTSVRPRRTLPPEPDVTPAMRSSRPAGWPPQSMFSMQDEQPHQAGRRRARWCPCVMHAVILVALLIAACSTPPRHHRPTRQRPIVHLVYLQQPGPGGGGGGSPAPAPPKPMEIPKHDRRPIPCRSMPPPPQVAAAPGPQLTAPDHRPRDRSHAGDRHVSSVSLATLRRRRQRRRHRAGHGQWRRPGHGRRLRRRGVPARRGHHRTRCCCSEVKPAYTQRSDAREDSGRG